MLGRWRATQASLQQSERMAQLGTLTAGLAHELNNPAAAVNRSAGQLPEAIERYGDARAAAALELGEINSPFLENLLESSRRRSGGTISLSALERADLEDEVETWLADHGVDRSWELAPGLVDAGMTVDRLSDLVDHVENAQLGGVIGLVDAAQEQLALVYQIEEGTRRMSAIVKALKSYAYLDQAPVQNVDVTVGLDDTLMLLEHKAKGIEVQRGVRKRSAAHRGARWRTQPGMDQPDRQRHLCRHGRGRRAADRTGETHRIRGSGRGRGQRSRHSRRDPVAYLRFILHYQTSRIGNGPGSGYQP